MASSLFTVDGSSTQAEHVTTYGGTVSLSLVSVTGVFSCVYSAVGGSHNPQTFPTFTYGTTVGNATFTFQSDPSDGQGRAILVECLVNGGFDANGKPDSSLRTRRLIGVNNGLDFLPLCANETTERDPVVGWLKAFNSMVAVLLPS